MDWPFISRGNKRPDQILAVDLGGRTTKAVQVTRRGDRLVLESYGLMDAPADKKQYAPDVLGEHLKTVHRALNSKARHVAIALSVNDSVFRQVELPPMPVADLRQMLKFNSKNYLQQDLPNYVFDCYYQTAASVGNGESGKNGSNSQKQKVLVGGARQAMIDNLQAAVKSAGLAAEQIIPGVLGPVNSFELNEPQFFTKDVVGLVDLGFQSTAITIVDKGEIILNRVVGIGGDHLTNGLASAMGISYAEAENIKVGMPNEVQPHLEALLAPLGRELRASIDFFEHQRDKTVSQVFVSGGSARSEFVVQALQAELIIPCKSWNPTQNVELALPPEQMSELEQAAPQLSVALGTAAAAL